MTSGKKEGRGWRDEGGGGGVLMFCAVQRRMGTWRRRQKTFTVRRKEMLQICIPALPKAGSSTTDTHTSNPSQVFYSQEQRYVNVSCYANTWWVFAHTEHSVQPSVFFSFFPELKFPALPHQQYLHRLFFFIFIYLFSVRSEKRWKLKAVKKKNITQTEKQTR